MRICLLLLTLHSFLPLIENRIPDKNLEIQNAQRGLCPTRCECLICRNPPQNERAQPGDCRNTFSCYHGERNGNSESDQDEENDQTGYNFPWLPWGRRFEIIELRGNGIHRLDAELLRERIDCSIADVKSLRLQDNKIGESPLPHGVFSVLPNLRELLLNGNGIKSIDAQHFAGLGKLRTLSLAQNKLTILKNGTFQNTPQLTGLDLSNNRGMSQIEPDLFLGIQNLCALNLSYTGVNMQLLPDLIRNLRRLEVLDISGLGRSVHATFHLVPKGLPLLRILNVSNSGIQALPHPDILERYTGLRHLDLSSNQISLIREEQLTALWRLENLSLQKNSLGLHLEEDGIFENMYQMERLDLSYNQLNRLDSRTFTGPNSPHRRLKRIAYLNLAGNQIHQIRSGALHPLPGLMFLNLSGNRIETLHGCLHCPDKSSFMVDLSNNPLSCDCRLSHTLLATSTRLLLVRQDRTFCQNPITLQGLPVLSALRVLRSSGKCSSFRFKCSLEKSKSHCQTRARARSQHESRATVVTVLGSFTLSHWFSKQQLLWEF